MPKVVCPKCGCGIFSVTNTYETPKRTKVTIMCRKCGAKLTFTLINHPFSY